MTDLICTYVPPHLLARRYVRWHENAQDSDDYFLRHSRHNVCGPCCRVARTAGRRRPRTHTHTHTLFRRGHPCVAQVAGELICIVHCKRRMSGLITRAAAAVDTDAATVATPAETAEPKRSKLQDVASSSLPSADRSVETC
jgi:hypothetical protein